MVGIREYAYRYGGGFRSVNEEDLPTEDFYDFSQSEDIGDSNITYSLFAFPAEDNFAGVRYPLRWIQQIQNGFFQDVSLSASLYCRARDGLWLSTQPPSSRPIVWIFPKSSLILSLCLSTKCSDFPRELARY